MRRALIMTCTLAMSATCGALLATTPVRGQDKPLPAEFHAYLTTSWLSRDAFISTPERGSEADKLDRDYFRRTRALEGTPRWAMATGDSGRGVLKAFSCAAGIALDDKNAAALVTLLSRYRTDLINVTRMAEAERASRPYDRDKGHVCIADKQLSTAIGTPAIQSAWGWTIAMLLAESLPDRAAQLMARGRAYGESAAICGFARASEVSGGRDLGAAMLARSRAEPEFRADLDKAISQLAALRRSGTAAAPAGCDAETAQLSVRLP